MAGKGARTAFWVGLVLATLAWTGPARAQVEIEYWQYTFAQRVQAIDELIKRFEAANPGIKVKHTHVPYDDFRVKIAAAIPAGGSVELSEATSYYPRFGQTRRTFRPQVGGP